MCTHVHTHTQSNPQTIKKETFVHQKDSIKVSHSLGGGEADITSQASVPGVYKDTHRHVTEGKT